MTGRSPTPRADTIVIRCTPDGVLFESDDACPRGLVAPTRALLVSDAPDAVRAAFLAMRVNCAHCHRSIAPIRPRDDGSRSPLYVAFVCALAERDGCARQGRPASAANPAYAVLVPQANADAVYQTVLAHGWTVQFEDGATVRLSSETVATVAAVVTGIERAAKGRAAAPGANADGGLGRPCGRSGSARRRVGGGIWRMKKAAGC